MLCYMLCGAFRMGLCKTWTVDWTVDWTVSELCSTMSAPA